MSSVIIDIIYLIASVLFIFGMKQLQSPATARGGNILGALGMFLAVVATLFIGRIIDWPEMILGVVVGAGIGAYLALSVKMTSMPEFVAAFNGFGGLASALVATSEIAKYFGPARSGSLATLASVPQTGGMEEFGAYLAVTIWVSIFIGYLTFSGSFVAFGKLGGYVSGNPVNFPGMRLLTVAAFLAAVAGMVMMIVGAYPFDSDMVLYGTIIVSVIALILGVLVVIPIGGADMPVVVALLNSYSGLAAAATGFVLNNSVLIISGALVGASGIILSKIMCDAMNRSLLNVLIGGFGGDATGEGQTALAEGKSITETSADDVAIMLAYAQKVVVVPGYGMAVAQAQHAVRELADQLAKKGVDVKYAVHPVAGRMPGHMNVLLAEANVPYDQLYEMDEINPDFDTTDVSLIIGANDVVNPAARHDKASPIYGMPILDVDKSAQVVVLKRSMRPGYAGVENELFYNSNTGMLFGDAKDSITKLVAAVKGL